MAPSRRKSHQWPRQPHTERRRSTRVTMVFPIDVGLDPRHPPIEARVLDLSLGGVRVVIDRYAELFSRFEVALEVPVMDPGGKITLERIETTGALVRIDPDEEGEPGTKYDAAIAFTRLTDEQERAIAMCQLQMLLFDPECEVL